MATSTTALHPGAVVRLSGVPDGTYQVVSIDDDSDRCWVRRWPLAQHRRPTFVVSLDQVRDVRPAAG